MGAPAFVRPSAAILVYRDLMNTEFMLLAVYEKPRLTMDEVCHAIGMSKGTAYNKRSARVFPIPMAGEPLTADIRDVAAYLDKMREESA